MYRPIFHYELFEISVTLQGDGYVLSFYILSDIVDAVNCDIGINCFDVVQTQDGEYLMSLLGY